MVDNKMLFENKNSFLLIAGPCAIEGEEMAFEIAEEILKITKKLNINFVFKGSFKKANRSRIDSFTGIGDKKALEILGKIRKDLSIPTTTDIHEVKDVDLVSNYVDILQIPAFLARQTDLIVAAAKTSKIVNIKKGQFMNPTSMKFAIEKVKDSGNNNAIITERGNTFGYQDLVVDFRSIPVMKNYAPVVMDVTHSLQQPNQTSGVTGGKPKLISTIAKAAIATGADGIFIETHPNPTKAKSDGANMLQLDNLEELLEQLIRVRQAVI